MPALHLEMHPGRTLDQKRAFVQQATKAVCETLNCPPESVEIIIREIPREHWGRGGKLVSEQ